MDLETALKTIKETPVGPDCVVGVITSNGKDFYIQTTHISVWDYCTEEGGGNEFGTAEYYIKWVKGE